MRSSCRKFVLLFSFFLMHSMYGYAQNSIDEWESRFYDSNSGLGNSVIKCFAQDSSGFLWIGTSQGLLRFNGNEFQPITIVLPDTIISQDYISDIQTLHNGDLIIIHGIAGLTRYSPKTKTFTNINPKRSSIFLNAQTGKSTQLSENEILVGSWKWYVYIVNMKNFTMKRVDGIEKFYDFGSSLYDTTYNFIVTYHGLIAYNKHDHSKTVVTKCSGSHTSFNQQKSYFSTLESKKILYYDLDSDNCISLINRSGHSSKINSLRSTSNKWLWVGTDTGLEIYNNVGQLVMLKTGDNKRKVECIYSDKNGNVWVGHYNGITHYHSSSPVVQSAEETVEYVYSKIIKLTDDSYALSSLQSNEILIWQPTSEKLAPIYNYYEQDSLQYLYSMEYDSTKLWLFFLNGIASFDVGKRKLEVNNFSQNTSYNNMQWKKVSFMDTSNNPWFHLQLNDYLIRINKDKTIDSIPMPIMARKGTYSHINFLPPHSFIYATLDSVCIYNSWLDSHYGMKLPVEEVISKRYSYDDMLIQNDSVLWSLNSNGTLRQSIIRNNEIRPISLSNVTTFSINNALDILLDPEENLYVLTKNAVHKYSVENIWSKVELDEVTLDRNNTLQLIDNKLFILSQGVHYIPLDAFSHTFSTKSVFIESVEVNNTKFPNFNGSSLDNNQNNLKIDFSAVEFYQPQSIEYKYRINNASSWKYVDYQSTDAVYSGLRPDDYSFQISARLAGGDWGEIETLDFSIDPPFYYSWYFITIGGLILGGLIYGLFVRRVRNIRKLSNMQTRMAELENEALRSQMNPHFIFNSLNSIKSFIIKNKKNEAADYLTQFSILIRTILNNSRKKSVSLEKEFEALDLYMEMENIRLDNKFDIIYNIDKGLQLSDIQIPPLTLQPFVENAIWHGFIHKKEKGKLIITVSKAKKEIQISIQDNGVGRIKSQQIEQKNSRKRSYGIFITKQRLNADKESNKESIIIEDLYNKEKNAEGTVITILLPHI